MLSRPVDYGTRSGAWRRIYLPERLTKRAAILFVSLVNLLLWLGIAAVAVKLWS
jgi:hypothetical protein